MDKFKLLHNHKSRTFKIYKNNNYYNLNRFKQLGYLLTILILFINFNLVNSFYQVPQQAPPTTLTVKNNQKYNTTYACEGSQLTINCEQPGSEINVIRSNFGRFSISICNSQGVLDWSVNCFSKNTVELIRRACNGQRQCLLQATTDLFGNPCPSTYKYLEVHYECTNKEKDQSQSEILSPQLNQQQSKNNNQLLSNQPINLNSNNLINPPVNSNLNNLVNNNKRISAPPSIIIPDNPLLKHHTHSNLNKQPTIPNVPIIFTTPSSAINNKATSTSAESDDLVYHSSQNNQLKSKFESTNDENNSQINSNSNTLNNNSSPTLYCPPVFERGLNWNRTEIDSYATQSCPPGSTGNAQWFCSPPTNNPNDLPLNANEPHWEPAQPIFAQCQSTWLTQLNRRMTNGESALLLSEELSNQIAETNQLYGGDIKSIAELLRLLLQPIELMIAQHQQQEQIKITKEMLAVSVFLFKLL